MTRRFGIDASILVRLLTGEPEADFALCASKLQARDLVQRHYGVSKSEVRDGLLSVLRSGLVAPLNGSSAMAAIDARQGAGLIDRLITDDYARAGLPVLTLDRKMSALPGAQHLPTAMEVR